MIWRILSNLLLRARILFWHVIYQGYRQQYCIASSFRFNGAGIQLYGYGRIELGEGSYIGELGSLQAAQGVSIRIGTKCSISHNVRIYTSTLPADVDIRKETVPNFCGSVHIGDGVWIGANTYIGPGVTIGDNAVIGANSVVTKSVPPSEIWGGVPARLIRVKRGSNE